MALEYIGTAIKGFLYNCREHQIRRIKGTEISPTKNIVFHMGAK
jgi:hypothetical protein